MLFFSCSFDQVGIDNNLNNKILDTPYTDVTELEIVTENTDKYVDWKVARIFAVMEKESFITENDWSNSKVSKRPIIIYNHELEPKYYEFRVIQAGVEIGAIACNAQKKGGKPIQYIMEYAKKYNASGTRGLNLKIIDNGYPANVIQGIINSKGALEQKIDPETGLPVNNDAAEFEVTSIDFLENADTEVLKKLGITTEEMKADLLQKAEEKQAEISEMWNQIESVKNLILKTTDNEIEAAANTSKALNRGNWTSQYIAYQWWNKANWINPGGWCGPNCLEFISIGANCYPGVTGTPGNNWNTVYSVYSTFVNETGTGAKVWEDLKSALAKYTTYTLNYKDFFSNKSHGWDKINSEMRAYAAPALSLRTWASVNGAWNWSWHYRVICGTKRVHTEWKASFLWWSWTESKNEDYYLMHDNGADGKPMSGGYNWWEVAGSFAQFESITVKKK